MEQGNGAPIGATGSVGKTVSFETGTPEFGSGSHESSFVQTEEFGNDLDHTADSHDEYSNEGSELVEGQETSFEGRVVSNDESPVEEISEPQMDPEKSLAIAKKDGFESALEYYAQFPVNGQHQEDDGAIIEGQLFEDSQMLEDDSEPQEEQEGQVEVVNKEEENEDIQEEKSNMMPGKEIQRPEIQQIIDVLKGQSEIMKKMIERLEDRQALTEEMLLLMAMAMRDALEAKDEKDEDEKTLLDTLVSVIGFLMGMIVDPDQESKRLQENVEKAA